MFKRPINAAQINRMTDAELEEYLTICESNSDHGILYGIACDEEAAREERTAPARAKVRASHQEEVRWC